MQQQPQTTTPTSNMLGLPPEVLSVIMGHVGPGSYRYVAGTCKTFRETIRKEFPNDVQTNSENIVGSKGCAQLYILEAPEKVADQGIEGSANAGRDWRSKSHDVAYWATLNGRTDILEWLNDKGVNLVPQRLSDRRGHGQRVPFDGVGNGGQLGCIPFYVKLGLDLDENMSLMISQAATNGHLAFLKHFHAQGVKVGDRFNIGYAARGGYLDVVKFFHQIGCPWDNFTCEAAAENGHLDILKYAHENGCDWTNNRRSANSVCCKAAKGGHLECLKYFHQNGGRIGISAAMLVTTGGHLDCLLYVSKCGFIVDKETFAKAAEAAIKNGNDSALWYLQGKINKHIYDYVEEVVIYGRKQYLHKVMNDRQRSHWNRDTWRPAAYPQYPCERRYSKFPDHVIKGTADAVYEELKRGLEEYRRTGWDDMFVRSKRKIESRVNVLLENEFYALLRNGEEEERSREMRMPSGMMK